jgi:uncharacterized RDD family membrane protein YckC
MNWFYADNGQQHGPVDDTQLDALAAAGTIRADTLVWAEGMAAWLPYSQASGPAIGADVPGGVQCSICGKLFSPDEVVRHGNHLVCSGCKPIFLQQLQEGVLRTAPGTYKYGGFWIRFAAKILDTIIIVIPTLAVDFILAWLMFATWFPEFEPGGDNALYFLYEGVTFLLGTVLGMAYCGFFTARFAATPGKMACGLKIIRPDGSPVSFWRAALRSLAEFLSAFICLIGYIMAAFDEEKRSLHDNICDTRVVKKK